VSRGEARAAGRALLHAAGVGFREWRTVAVLLAVNWIVALLMIAPALSQVVGAYGHAPRSVGKPVLSPELLLGLRPVLDGGGPSVVAPLVLLVLLQTLVAGGVVWRTCDSGPFRLGAFLGQSGRLVGRNARLYLWLLPVLLLAAVGVGGAAALMHALGLPTVFTMEPDVWLFGRPFGAWSLLHLGLVGLGLASWRLSLDVGRVVVFQEDLRSTRRVAWRSLRIALASPGWLVLYAVLGTVATLAVLLAARVRAALPEGTAVLALLALVAGQAVLWIRLSFQVAGVRFAATLVERRRTSEAGHEEPTLLPVAEEPEPATASGAPVQAGPDDAEATASVLDSPPG
jgi:hypothetical protein